MNIFTSDFECTTFNKGNPFDSRNKAVCLGVKNDNYKSECLFIADTFNLTALQTKLNNSLCVFFNAKFDLHWYRKLGLDVSNTKIWCCQIAEFLLSGQHERYPSLEATAVKYGLGNKVDIVNLEYWSKGIDTDAIPPEVLGTYCRQDVDLTYQIYLKQLEQLEQNPALYQLFKVMCADCLVLEEMEWNGITFKPELCVSKSKEIEEEIAQITSQLSCVYPDVPINFNSGDQLSAFLYGGTIPNMVTEHVGFYKNGNPKYKKVDKPFVLPRLVEPLKNSQLLKEGVYKTDEATLRKLKGPAAKKYVAPLLRLSELEKLNSTYYKGLLQKAEEGHWEPNTIHGQFNQVVAGTGRLSSSKPNLQNFAEECLDIFVSRYG